MGLYQARVASFLWAVALIVSFNSSSSWLGDLGNQWSVLTALASALALLSRPESLFFLRLSIATYVVSAFSIMPNIPNHRVVLLFAGFALFLGSFSRSKSSQTTANLRWLTIIVYLFAALAKCNVDYLNASTSCASLFFTESLKLHGVRSMEASSPGSGVSWMGGWSLIAETVLVGLLIPRKTRPLGVMMGIGFHLFLATHFIKYFANFSGAMCLLLCSWLSEEQSKRLVSKHLHPRNGVFVAGGLSMCATLIAHESGSIGSGTWVILRYAIWSILGLFLLCAVAESVRAESSVEGHGALTAPSAILVVLALLNGFSPYLGIKTRSGFSMYSNLRIEPQYSNHLFMPASADLLGYLSDTVQIVSSSDQVLSQFTKSDSEKLPYISLCAYLAGMDDNHKTGQSEVLYERKGERFTRIRGAELPDDCPPWIARKLLLYGAVGDGAERHCIW